MALATFTVVPQMTVSWDTCVLSSKLPAPALAAAGERDSALRALLRTEPGDSTPGDRLLWGARGGRVRARWRPARVSVSAARAGVFE